MVCIFTDLGLHGKKNENVELTSLEFFDSNQKKQQRNVNNFLYKNVLKMYFKCHSNPDPPFA
jgi:hypothetical protein